MEKGESTYSRRELWLLVPFLFLVFWLATPYDIRWPQEVKNKENYIQVTEAIQRMEGGNVGRRIGLVILAVGGLFILSRTRNRFQVNGLTGWALILFLCWTTFSLVWSIDIMFTIRRMTIFFILWFAAVAVSSRYTIKDLAIVIFSICSITGILALINEFRFHTFNPFSESWRFSGLFHTVAMGWNCGLAALAAFYLGFATKSRPLRIFYFVAFGLAMLLLLLTKSRMALFSTVMAVGFIWIMVSSMNTKVFVTLSLVATVCLLYLFMGPKVTRYGESITTLGRGEVAKESVGTLTGRLPLWKECFRWAAKRPLTGYGFNTFISPKHYVEISQNVGWTPSSIHSGYIDAIMGLGYIGFALMLGFLLGALFRALALARNGLNYVFVSAVLMWLCYNLFLEANLINRPTFMTFASLTMISHLAFLPAEEVEPVE